MRDRKPNLYSPREFGEIIKALGCPEERIQATCRDFRIIVPTLMSTDAFVDGDKHVYAQVEQQVRKISGKPHFWTIYLYLWHMHLMLRYRGRRAGFAHLHPLDQFLEHLTIETKQRSIRYLRTPSNGDYSDYLAEVRAEQSLLIHYLNQVKALILKYSDYLRSDIPLAEIEELKTKCANSIARTEDDLQRAKQNKEPFSRTNDVEILEDELGIHRQNLNLLKELWGTPTSPCRAEKPKRVLVPAVFDQVQLKQFLHDVQCSSGQHSGVIRWYRYMLPALMIHFGEEEILQMLDSRKQDYLLADHTSSWKSSVHWIVAWAKHIVEEERANLDLIPQELKPTIITIEIRIGGVLTKEYTHAINI